MKKSGIYIHIPFCVKRCRYCDFYSEVVKNRDVLEDYGDKVISELVERFNELEGTEVVSLYIGGGTPSQMDEEFFSDLTVCADELGLNFDKMEVTVEVNPADISDKWLKKLKSSGVNRISVGIQAFDDHVLSEMGRRVTVNDMKEKLPIIASNFENLSIDMIYGIGKDRDITQELEDVFNIIDPTHISAYQYMKPEKKNAPVLLDEDETFVQESALRGFLEKRGFNRYEISNYSKKGRESVHNSIYWSFGSWLGIGAGARSFNEKRREHSFYAEDIDSFLNGEGLSRYYPDKDEQIREFLLMGLRLTDGIDLNKFKELFGEPVENMVDKNVLDGLRKEGLIVIDEFAIKCCEKGLDFLNQVLLRLFDGVKIQK